MSATSDAPSSSSDSASTVALPLVTYGVRPAVPSIRTSSEPIVNGFNRPITRPCASIAAVIPVFVARSIGRPVSSERIRAICRCWSSAIVSPNHARFVTLTSTPGDTGLSRIVAAISSPKMSS